MEKQNSMGSPRRIVTTILGVFLLTAARGMD
jgi:hypothetical protein